MEEFDLDTHVGLIQRLLQVDPKLVEMHSRLSSGGEKEVTFWKNYFFHCAYARYEAGLSIDEIWSSERPIRRAVPATAGTDAGFANNNTSNEEEDYNIVDSVVGDRSQSEEEVLFESGSSSTESSSNDIKTASAAAAAVEEKLFTPSAPAATPIKQIVQPSPTSEPNSVTHRTNTADSYEFISDNGGDDDGSMDELEAEIAAALGD